MKTIPLSILDLAPIRADETAADAFRNTLELARCADQWGYTRYWLAEHHNFPGIASAATAVLIGYVASGTSRIRVGSGGVMLPNHAPLVIAEQFGTLESLYPGRIDLGVGRAPGTDQRTARALRRHLGSSGDTFPQDLQELQSYFAPLTEGQAVRAVPGHGLNVPIWLLGSSDFSARLAAELGLPFAFASHFAPDYLFHALDLYRASFKPSPWLDRPYAMVGANIVAADTDADARRLFTTVQQGFLNLVRGTPGRLAPPIEPDELAWSPLEQAHVERMTRVSVVGSHATVRAGVEELARETGADEIIVAAQIYEHAARLRSYEILARICELTAQES
jgi:luciferase family oxidoreductase group 1